MAETSPKVWRFVADFVQEWGFSGRHYIAFLTGQCLKLKEGQTAGEVFTAMVMLKAKNPPPAFPEWRGPTLKRIINLAVPAELNAAFGMESFSWLQSRSEDFARDYARKGCTHGSPARRLFDGGDVGFLPDRVRRLRPEPDSIPVVPAPNEVTIAQYIERAASSADHWDVLTKAAAMLHRYRQPVGDALQGWLIEAADLGTARLKRTTAAKWPRDVLHDYVIVEAVRALERCGMKVVSSNRAPGPACEAVGKAISKSPVTVLNHWKKR